MSWTLLYLLLLILVLALVALYRRRGELVKQARVLEERSEARAKGSHKALLQYPHVDLDLCIGCGKCVRACPEDGVLGLAHGQAVVLHGARCVGHAVCAKECPTGGIQVRLEDIKSRTDIPALDESLQAIGMPGLFLAGEVTGYALVKTAIRHGQDVATRVAQDLAEERPVPGELHDLVIVGAGPAGISCALRAKELGISAVLLEQESIGGTVSKYPRRKLVLTQPVELPLYGRLKRSSYLKEELMEIWTDIVEQHELDVRTGHSLKGVRKERDGSFTVTTTGGSVRGRKVCLCLGRRGSPRKLGVPGEDLPKVAYSLIDAQAYDHRRILVVGGGDSAVEAAMALAEQDGNQVTLSYRKRGFSRIKSRNEDRLERMIAGQQLEILFESDVREIRGEDVVIEVKTDQGPRLLRLPNDDVFVFAGGVPPFQLLEAAGVSFDPEQRQAAEEGERGTGLYRALQVALVLVSFTLIAGSLFTDYYRLPWMQRPDSAQHDLLAPSRGVGLVFGVLATVLILWNLLYLVRRSRLGRWIAGTLQHWLSVHLVTGLAALCFVLLHGGMSYRDSPGGHAFLALVVLVVSGAIGRYLYAWLPKAANGKELRIEETRSRLGALLGEWDLESRTTGGVLDEEMRAFLADEPWEKSFLARLGKLLTSRRRMRRSLARLERRAREKGMGKGQVAHLLATARKLHRASLAASHYEDLRGLLSSWRFVHRWVALAMVLLAAIHIATALKYARLFG